MKTVEGLNSVPFRNCSNKTILEVSLVIRFLIPEAAFGVDFFVLLSPNMKKDFISLGNAQGIDLLIHLRVKHIKKTDMSNLFLILVIISILEVYPRKTQ